MFLLSCSDKENIDSINVELNSAKTNTWTIKKTNIVKEKRLKTIKLKDIINSNTIKKWWKIIDSDYFDIKSSVLWEVKELLVKEWDKVKKWQILIRLSDNNSLYTNKLENKGDNLSKLEEKLESKTMESDRQINYLEEELERRKEEYLEKTREAQITLLKAEVEYEKSKNKIWISESNPKVLEFDKKIDKLEFEYMNIVNSNKEESWNYINNINENFIKTKEELKKLIDLSNLLFSKDNKFWYLIWAKDKIHKSKTVEMLSNLVIEKDKLIKNNFSNLNEWNVIKIAEDITWVYSIIFDYIKELEIVLNDSITSVGLLEQTEINKYKWVLVLIKKSINLIKTDYFSLINNTRHFLLSYKNVEKTHYDKFDLLKKERENFLKHSILEKKK